MHKPQLTGFFDQSRRASRPLALVLVTGTSGSTYSKAGDCMLIDDEGRYQGMLSGGCLEGDLALHAAEVIAAGGAEALSYDLAADDELWGLGVGCDGRIDVLLIALDAAGQPFAAMNEVFAGREHAYMALVIADERLATGSAVIAGGDGRIFYAAPGADALLSDAPEHGAIRESDDGARRVLELLLAPAPNLLVLGAGPDVVPVLRLAHELGWRTTVADHRPAYIESDAVAIAGARHHVVPAELGTVLDPDAYDAVVIMSHHLASDRAYLDALATTSVGYVGLLGPAARRDRLLADLGERASTLVDRLDGPAGLDLGGRGPGQIALSIVAGVQRYLVEREAARTGRAPGGSTGKEQAHQ